MRKETQSAVVFKSYETDVLEALKNELGDWCANKKQQSPFIIAVNGCISVGKSTFAEQLGKEIAVLFRKEVRVLSTDHFLYPNNEMKNRNLFWQKGFPETHDFSLLIETLKKVKQAVFPFEIPIYSHQAYDILTSQRQKIEQTDILILEGLVSTDAAIAQFIDYSIYLDAEYSDIQDWYLERCKKNLLAVKDKKNELFSLKQFSTQEQEQQFQLIWQMINHKNYRENILPKKYQNDAIIFKNHQHQLSRILIRM